MTIVDTDGEALRLAVRAEPDVVSPNVVEAEELVGHEFNDDADRAGAVREIVSLGARSAIMTMPDGCWAQMLHEGSPRVYRVTVPLQDSVATVGSGDACLAGYVAAHYRGEPPAEHRDASGSGGAAVAAEEHAAYRREGTVRDQGDRLNRGQAGQR